VRERLCTRASDLAVLGGRSTWTLDTGIEAMRLRFTPWRLLAASGLSLLFILQAFAPVAHGNRTVAMVRAGLALFMSAFCFWAVLSYRSDSQRAAEGEGSVHALRWRRWRLVLWVVLFLLAVNLMNYWRSLH
jgi:hypothetical protein